MSNDKILSSVTEGFSETIHRIIGNTFIVAYGIIKEIPADGVVRVELSTSDSAEDVVITDCVYANIASSAFAIKVVPVAGDKVMILFPKSFHNEMFKQDKSEVIISEASKGYNVLSGIAIPVNQFQSFHKNYIEFNEGAVTAKLAYSESDEENKVEFTAGSDGALELKNPKVTVTADADGIITVDNGKAEIKVDDSGNVSIDAKAGKVTVKNSASDLFTILNGILTLLNSGLPVVGAVPAGSTDPIVTASLFTAQTTQLAQLLQS